MAEIIRFNPLPPVITVPCWALTLRGNVSAQTVLNTFYYVQGPGATTLPTLDAVRVAFKDVMQTPYLNVHSEDYALTRVICQRFDIPGSLVSFDEPGLLGNIEDESMPPNVSAQIRRVTAWPGQRGRGAIRLGGIPESSASSGVLTGGFLALLDTFATAMKTNLATANPTDGALIPHILTREVTLDPLPLATVYGAQVTDCFPNNYTGSQNSRKHRTSA